MEPLSLFAMIWQEGVFCCVAAPIVILVGMGVYALFKPIEFFDKL